MWSVREGDYVFPGEKPDQPLSDMALTEVIRREFENQHPPLIARTGPVSPEMKGDS